MPYILDWISKGQVLSTLFWRGLHFLLVRSKMPRLCGRLSDLPGARSAQLCKDFDFLAPRNTKFCSPAGTSLWGLATIGSWLSKYWNIYWIWISSLSIGKRYAIFLRILILRPSSEIERKKTCGKNCTVRRPSLTRTKTTLCRQSRRAVYGVLRHAAPHGRRHALLARRRSRSRIHTDRAGRASTHTTCRETRP